MQATSVRISPKFERNDRHCVATPCLSSSSCLLLLIWCCEPVSMFYLCCFSWLFLNKLSFFLPCCLLLIAPSFFLSLCFTSNVIVW